MKPRDAFVAVSIASTAALHCGGSQTTPDASDVASPVDASSDATDGSSPIDTLDVPDTAEAGDAADASNGVIDPGIISRMTSSSWQAETSLAVADDGAVAVTWMGIPSNGIINMGYAISLDRGQTFATSGRVSAPTGQYVSDPFVVADAQGNFQMVFLSVPTAGGTPTRVMLATAMHGATTFGMPVEISDPMSSLARDRPSIARAHDGSLLAFWSEGPSDTMITAEVEARSTDGTNWTRETIATATQFIDFGFPCPSPTSDTVWFTHGGESGVALRWSADDGVTWNASDTSTVFSDAQVFGDPKCATDGTSVWVVDGTHTQPFTGASAFPPLDGIRVARSSDGGHTFDAMGQAADTMAAPLFQRPVMVAEPSGAVDVMYYAGTMEGDTMGSYRWSRSTDRGATFGPSVIVHTPLDFTMSRTSQRWIGDYTGIAWSAGAIYTSYADNSGLSSHVAFYRSPTP